MSGKQESELLNLCIKHRNSELLLLALSSCGYFVWDEMISCYCDNFRSEIKALAKENREVIQELYSLTLSGEKFVEVMGTVLGNSLSNNLIIYNKQFTNFKDEFEAGLLQAKIELLS